MLKLSFCISALALCAVLPAQRFTIPNGFSTTEAPSSSNLPWGYGGTTSSRTIYAYDATHFTGQGISGKTTITRMRWRGNGGVKYAGGGAYSQVIITLSTYAKAISTLATGVAFAGQHGKDKVEVYNGAVSVGKLSGTTPNDWHIDVYLQKPFTYDPSKGPLLIELQGNKAGFGGPSMGNIRLDLGSTASSGYNRMYDTTDHLAKTATGANECGAVTELITPLHSDVDSVVVSTGGTQNLMVNATKMHGGKDYWIFGSATGTTPGVTLGGVHFPLNPDVYTNLTISAANTATFLNFKGKLAGDGTATASFVVPANSPVPVGFKLYHACLVYDAATGAFIMTSGAIPITFK